MSENKSKPSSSKLDRSEASRLAVPRRRVKVHRSHSENIGRWQQRHLAAQRQAKSGDDIPVAESGVAPVDHLPESNESTEPGERDSGISLGLAGQTEVPLPSSEAQGTPSSCSVPFSGHFQPWEKYVGEQSENSSNISATRIPVAVEASSVNTRQGLLPPSYYPVSNSLPLRTGFSVESDVFSSSSPARDRLGGAMTLDRRGIGRYWWNGYEKQDRTSGRHNLMRARSFSMGRGDRSVGGADLALSDTGDLTDRPSGACHLRVTSDPTQLEQNLTNCRIIPINIESNPMPKLLYEGPQSRYGPSAHSAAPTGGRYPFTHTAGKSGYI
ncbi:hypothetical protein LSH36_51g06006 [Paralvinella palmiformis]|uniref:Uncharacterized protein n=1 Tax=Paralvinella palmiformis TaxID=53620 RepID=A0AAD9K5X8_9ANNE|nr:hypothetical protein LSH36_51g06006 [Paralvinella palmiformis]